MSINKTVPMNCSKCKVPSTSFKIELLAFNTKIGF